MHVLVEVTDADMGMVVRRAERLGESVEGLLKKAVAQFAYAERMARAGRAWAKRGETRPRGTRRTAGARIAAGGGGSGCSGGVAGVGVVVVVGRRAWRRRDCCW